jgi:hypothetical protein
MAIPYRRFGTTYRSQKRANLNIFQLSVQNNEVEVMHSKPLQTEKTMIRGQENGVKGKMRHKETWIGRGVRNRIRRQCMTAVLAVGWPLEACDAQQYISRPRHHLVDEAR